MIPAQERRRRTRRTSVAASAVVGALAALSVVGLATYRPDPGPVEAVPRGPIVAERDRPLAVFVGDSYTQGRGSSSEKARWSTRVADKRGWRELNYGLGGTGYAASAGVEGCGQAFCPDYLSSVPEVGRLSPDVVVVAGGQNDFAAFERDRAGTAVAVQATLEGLRKELPEAELVVVGPSTTGSAAATARAMETVVRRAAGRVDATFISLLRPRPVIEPDMVLADKTHVNDAGHRAIAERVLAELP